MVENHTAVRIQAPCRIHLGLLSVRPDNGRCFGGAGVMLREPALQVTMEPAASDSFVGSLASRARKFVARWRSCTGIQTPVAVQIHAAPPQHVGLGLGTQLGLSIATGLDRLFDRHSTLVERARSVGRGLRSAVGAHGFERGGLIIEHGKQNGEDLGELAVHVPLPEDWHVLLVRAQGSQGLAGSAEIQAFASLEDGSAAAHRGELRALLFDDLLPAAVAQNFGEFSEAVFHYGLRAGEMFASAQGGPFQNPSIADLVAYCRDHGVRGVGQSSWGPTVFCWFPSRMAAEHFRTQHLERLPNLKADFTLTTASRQGARIVIA